jgi:hypothetical protein
MMWGHCGCVRVSEPLLTDAQTQPFSCDWRNPYPLPVHVEYPVEPQLSCQALPPLPLAQTCEQLSADNYCA